MNRLLYSHGEPAGIGIDLVLYLSKSKFWQDMRSSIICIADIELLRSRSEILGLKIQFVEVKNIKFAKKNKFGTIQFIQISSCKDSSSGSLKPKNAKEYVKHSMHSLTVCTEWMLCCASGTPTLTSSRTACRRHPC